MSVLHNLIRYKYENNRVTDVSSSDVNSPLHYELYGNGKIGGDVPSKGSQNQLLERQVLFFINWSFHYHISVDYKGKKSILTLKLSKVLTILTLE